MRSIFFFWEIMYDILYIYAEPLWNEKMNRKAIPWIKIYTVQYRQNIYSWKVLKALLKFLLLFALSCLLRKNLLSILVISNITFLQDKQLILSCFCCSISVKGYNWWPRFFFLIEWLEFFSKLDQRKGYFADSCGGNLLMNVGPTSQGTIDPIFELRLR